MPPFTNVGISWVLLVASPAIPLLGVVSLSLKMKSGWVGEYTHDPNVGWIYRTSIISNIGFPLSL
jgi:hypothetical protein